MNKRRENLLTKQLETTLKLSLNFKNLESITDKWGFFRQLYMENITEILEVSLEDKRKWANIYTLDWPAFFSPIEQVAWNSIRCLGNTVLYPQFPLFNYFIDFANPYLKIGIELDGQEYHDPKKDRERDKMLFDYGWRIFRIKGSETAVQYMDIYEIEREGIIGEQKQKLVEHWLLNTCDGFFNAIKYWYFLDEQGRKDIYTVLLYPDQEVSEYDTDLLELINIRALAKSTLENHRLVPFPL